MKGFQIIKLCNLVELGKLFFFNKSENTENDETICSMGYFIVYEIFVYPKFATAPLSFAHVMQIEKKIADICEDEKYLPNKMIFSQ